MTHTLVQGIEKQFIDKKTPIIRPGYQVRVHQKIKEGNKERIQVFEGLVIGTNAGHGASKTFTVRKVVQGIGVEKIFPVYSPRIAKIEIKKTFKVRRAKLSYLAKEGGLSKRLSAKLGLIERDELLKQKKGLIEEQEATMDEAVKKAEEEAKAEESTVEEKAAPVEKAETEVKTEAELQDSEKTDAADEAPDEAETKEEKTE